MNRENIEHYDYINTIESMTSILSKSDSEDDSGKSSDVILNDHDKNLIILFNKYISSNRNFKYNGTYLNDMLEKFENSCKKYKVIKEKAEEIKQSIEDKYLSMSGCYIVINHVFAIYETANVLHIDTVLNQINEIKRIKVKDKAKAKAKELNLWNELKNFNLYDMDDRNIIISYYGKYEFTERQKLEDRYKLNEVIAESFEKRKKDNSDGEKIK